MSSSTAQQKQSSASSFCKQSSAATKKQGSNSDTSKPSTSPISDLTTIKSALNKTLFRCNYDPKAFPSFSTLFPESTLPEINSDQSTEDFQSLLKSTTMQVISSMKKILKDAKLHVPRLPQEIFLLGQELALHALSKPGKPKKQPANPASPDKEPAPLTPRNQDKQKKPSSQAPSKPSAPTPSSSRSRKESSKKQKPTKGTTDSSNVKQPSASDIMSILKSSTSPQFAFTADHTPAFTELFPNTSVPSNTMKSGFTFIDPVHLKPLLQMRLNAAKNLLRKNKINVSRLPNTFVRSQIRLISASVHKLHETKRQAKKEKAKRQKAAKAQLAKTQSSKLSSSAPQFVRPTQIPPLDAKDSVPTQNQDSENEHPLFSVREKKLRMRALVHTLQATILPNSLFRVECSTTSYPTGVPLGQFPYTPSSSRTPLTMYVSLDRTPPSDLLPVLERFNSSPSDFSGSLTDLFSFDSNHDGSNARADLKTNLAAYLQALDDVTSISASALF